MASIDDRLGFPAHYMLFLSRGTGWSSVLTLMFQVIGSFVECIKTNPAEIKN